MHCVKTGGWSENQIIAAFGQFHNRNSEKKIEEINIELRDLLKSRNKSLFDIDDIFFIAGQFVPNHCSDKLAHKIIGVLEKN